MAGRFQFMSLNDIEKQIQESVPYNTRKNTFMGIEHMESVGISKEQWTATWTTIGTNRINYTL